MRNLLPILSLIILFTCAKKEIVKKESEKAAPEFKRTAYIIRETVNVRSSHTTDSQIIKQLHDGDPVKIIQNQNGWYEIYDSEGNRGWVRTDMAGPEDLSRTRLAAAFADTVLPQFNAELYFDKTDLYRTIYLILPSSYYTSEETAKSYGEKIGREYQKAVYPGKLEIRIMETNQQDLFTRMILDAINNPDIPVPIINEGILSSIEQNNWQVKINIAVPDSTPDARLLKQARRISSAYKLPYTKVEVFQAADTEKGRQYLENHENKPADSTICRLYYLEDKDGEYHKFDYCR